MSQEPKDKTVDKYLDKHRDRPQFQQESGRPKTRTCRLCGRGIERDAYSYHMTKHQ